MHVDIWPIYTITIIIITIIMCPSLSDTVPHIPFGHLDLRSSLNPSASNASLSSSLLRENLSIHSPKSPPQSAMSSSRSRLSRNHTNRDHSTTLPLTEDALMTGHNSASGNSNNTRLLSWRNWEPDGTGRTNAVSSSRSVSRPTGVNGPLPMASSSGMPPLSSTGDNDKRKKHPIAKLKLHDLVSLEIRSETIGIQEEVLSHLTRSYILLCYLLLVRSLREKSFVANSTGEGSKIGLLVHLDMLCCTAHVPG